MKKLLVIIALVISLGIVGSMFGETASAQFFRIPMATVGVGPGYCCPAMVAARCVPACVPCCVPYCAPVYTCTTAKKAAKPKAAGAEKKEKKEKKDKK